MLVFLYNTEQIHCVHPWRSRGKTLQAKKETHRRGFTACIPGAPAGRLCKQRRKPTGEDSLRASLTLPRGSLQTIPKQEEVVAMLHPLFLCTQLKLIRAWFDLGTQKKNIHWNVPSSCFGIVCGERGIRTPGTSQYVGFQDRCNRPLCHLS